MIKDDETIKARRKLVSEPLILRMQELLKQANAAKGETQMVPIAGAVLVLDQPGGPKALVAFGNLPPNLDPQTFEKAFGVVQPVHCKQYSSSFVARNQFGVVLDRGLVTVQ